MGVRGLKAWLEVNCPATPVNWNQFKNTKIGVDILPFLYHAKAKGECIITMVAKLVNLLRSHGSEPILFFDGKPPSEKTGVVKERATARNTALTELEVLTKELEDGPDRAIVELEIEKLQRKNPNVTYAERDLVKKFLYTIGVRYVNAKGESDPLLAYWTNSKILSAVISPDMDLLPRGIEHLILKNEAGDWVQYTQTDILRSVRLTMHQFQMMCVLLGTDYTTTVRTIPVRTAYSAVKDKSSLAEIWSALRQKESDISFLESALLLLQGTSNTLETLLNANEIIKWNAPNPSIEPEEFLKFKMNHFPLELEFHFLQSPVTIA